MILPAHMVSLPNTLLFGRSGELIEKSLCGRMSIIVIYYRFWEYPTTSTDLIRLALFLHTTAMETLRITSRHEPM
jgi:hypothetical protein